MTYTQPNGYPDYTKYLKRCIGFCEEGSGELTQESAKVYLKALNLMTPDGELLLRENEPEEKSNTIDDSV